MKKRHQLLSASIALLLGACATAGVHVSGEGHPTRVALHLYKNGLVLELVNTSHTDPLDAYSQTRSGSKLKVVSDSRMAELLEYLGDHGFGKHEEGGSAPPGRGPYILAFEIESPNGVTHWGTSAADPPGVQRDMQECYRYFINDVYNDVQGFQSIENPEGEKLFKKAPTTVLPSKR